MADGLPLHVHVGDEELRGVGVHGSLGQLDVARHGAAESCWSEAQESEVACTVHNAQQGTLLIS